MVGFIQPLLIHLVLNHCFLKQNNATNIDQHVHN